ncbi:hypothetical protein FPZ12_020295 [Amycolatopsis acidicola]|uniref:Uncharacterized protein n=1 Tax=Amycolatopsis acidicola TaxID=2596893 RepID=A0A5N0V1G2_9PSEU|nr:hypothetical protein [Amycolatopsis acidicola]KAA9159445.1 hypothetical protein FPZ12_020295 [Amycolatopsis acidicola]
MCTNPNQVQALGITAITDLDPALFSGDGKPRDTNAPNDIVHDNTRKAGFAATAVNAYAAQVGNTYEDFYSLISDLIGDLYHLADALGIDLADAIRHGRDDYLAEISPA